MSSLILFTASQVELTEVDGDDAEVRTTSRARNLEVHREGGPQGHDEVDFDWAKSRELQSGVRWMMYHEALC